MASKRGHLITTVIGYYMSEYEISAVSSTTLKIGSTTYTSRQFSKHVLNNTKKLQEVCGASEWVTALGGVMTKKKLSSLEEAIALLGEKVFDEIIGELKLAIRDITKGISSDAYLDAGYSYRNKIMIIDRGSKERIIYDTERRCVDEGSCYDSWENYKKMQPKEIKELMASSVIVSDIIYEPFLDVDAKFDNINGQEGRLVINSYNTPLWRQKEIKDPVLPEMFDKIMRYMLNDHEESLEYVYHWVYTALTSKNYTILLLNAGRGTGKNIFAEILRRLFGMRNFQDFPSSFMESRFNGELKNKRMCFFDEFDVLMKHMNTWRQLPEEYIAIEEKGLPTKTYRNHSNYLITNNTDRIVQLSQDERKFSVPICRDQCARLDEVYGPEVIDLFVREVEDNSELIAQIGWWILKHGESPKFNNRMPYKSPMFQKVVERGLANWQRGVIEFISNGEYDEIPIEALTDILKGTGRTKLERFLTTHKDAEGDTYGYLKQITGGDRVIIPHDKYKPTKKSTPEKIKNTVDNIEEMEF